MGEGDVEGLGEGIHAFNHHAMSTWWQVRISGEEEIYASQAAQEAFVLVDRMESLMSRFREGSEISILSSLPAGGRYLVSAPVFECLSMAARYQIFLGGAFDVCAATRQNGSALSRWHLDPWTREFVADTGDCRVDLGAIAKGYTLDQIAVEMEEWGIESFLLMSSGSSILAGDPPSGDQAWRVRLSDGEQGLEILLSHGGIGTSGSAMRGDHIINPATGISSNRHQRSWAISDSAAEADALSTAWMNMNWDQIQNFCSNHPSVGAVIMDDAGEMRSTGKLTAIF
jgi:thiamine biosynthesis lipoprotein